MPRSPWLGQQMQIGQLKRREFIALFGSAAAEGGSDGALDGAKHVLMARNAG